MRSDLAIAGVRPEPRPGDAFSFPGETDPRRLAKGLP